MQTQLKSNTIVAVLVELVVLVLLLNVVRLSRMPEEKRNSTGYSKTRGQLRDYDPTVGVPEQYQFIFEPGLDPASALAAELGVPYDSIQFERTRCFGSCPSYVVTFHYDGRAEYEGREYAPRMGKFVGETHVINFGRLCWAIDKFQLQKMKQEYHAGWTDDASAIIRVKGKSSEDDFEIQDYGRYGPIQLWILLAALDSVCSEIEWKKAPPEAKSE